METLFPDNPARRLASKKGGESKSGVKKANESDVSPLHKFMTDDRLKNQMWRTKIYVMQFDFYVVILDTYPTARWDFIVFLTLSNALPTHTSSFSPLNSPATKPPTNVSPAPVVLTTSSTLI